MTPSGVIGGSGDRATCVRRRQTLAPGEASAWHVDPCRRYSIVLSGERLAIEFQDTGERLEFAVHRGMAGWDAPEPRVHRAINVGSVPFEEAVSFLRADAGQDCQPVIDVE
ncbi:MAG: hypothetical protein H6993_06700 [Pseudomonadales bacterium]|nr:hypothetical protein [Pseudomonadales bacterium]